MKIIYMALAVSWTLSMHFRLLTTRCRLLFTLTLTPHRLLHVTLDYSSHDPLHWLHTHSWRHWLHIHSWIHSDTLYKPWTSSFRSPSIVLAFSTLLVFAALPSHSVFLFSLLYCSAFITHLVIAALRSLVSSSSLSLVILCCLVSCFLISCLCILD